MLLTSLSRSDPSQVCFTGDVWRLLEPLRAEDREAFLSLARRRTFARNEVLCHEGDPADSLHLVEHGHLAVHGGLASGASATFTILSSGDYFGELALLRADRRRTATVTALEPSRTLAVAASTFDALCSRNPGIERIVLRPLGRPDRRLEPAAPGDDV